MNSKVLQQDCVGEWCPIFPNLRQSSDVVGITVPLKCIALSPDAFSRFSLVGKQARVDANATLSLLVA